MSDLIKPKKSDLKYINIDITTLKSTFDHELYIQDLEAFCVDLQEENINDQEDYDSQLSDIESENKELVKEVERLQQANEALLPQVMALRKLVAKYENSK